MDMLERIESLQSDVENLRDEAEYGGDLYRALQDAVAALEEAATYTERDFRVTFYVVVQYEAEVTASSAEDAISMVEEDVYQYMQEGEVVDDSYDTSPSGYYPSAEEN